MEAVLFYILAATAAASALGCVLSVNVVRMAVCLLGTLGAVAVLYFLMSAYFIGAIQLIVYAGGTLVVIIFGVMLTSQSPAMRFTPQRIEVLAGSAVCIGLFAALAATLVWTDWASAGGDEGGYQAAAIGESLLTTYLVPFELVSVLLLAVMIGAAYLVRRERHSQHG